MKKIFAASILVVLTCAGSLAAQEYKGPRIEVKEMRHDSGKVIQGTPVSHVFEVKSVGQEALEIERVQAA